MYSRIIINIIFLLSLFVLQFAFVSGLPGWLNSTNLVLIVLIFLISMDKAILAFWWLLGLGFLMEMFSFLPSGVIIVSLSLVFLLVYTLLINYFTDRTLYTFFAITLIATLAYEMLLYSLNYIIAFMTRGDESFGLNASFWLQIMDGLAINLILVFLFYHTVNYLSKNLKPVFLIRRK